MTFEDLETPNTHPDTEARVFLLQLQQLLLHAVLDEELLEGLEEVRDDTPAAFEFLPGTELSCQTVDKFCEQLEDLSYKTANLLVNACSSVDNVYGFRFFGDSDKAGASVVGAVTLDQMRLDEPVKELRDRITNVTSGRELCRHSVMFSSLEARAMAKSDLPRASVYRWPFICFNCRNPN